MLVAVLVVLFLAIALSFSNSDMQLRPVPKDSQGQRSTCPHVPPLGTAKHQSVNHGQIVIQNDVYSLSTVGASGLSDGHQLQGMSSVKTCSHETTPRNT